MSENDFLKRVYADEERDTASFYNEWAATYDADLEGNGYLAPKRCADALALVDPTKACPIADLGCGTGLSGVAFRAAGFATIDGYDISVGMLELAKQRGCYRHTAIADLSDASTIPARGYKHAALTGVVGPDQVGPETVDLALSLLPVGGCVVLTLNDKALRFPEYPDHMHALADRGAAELAFEEYGPHIPERDIGATIYVLKKALLNVTRNT